MVTPFHHKNQVFSSISVYSMGYGCEINHFGDNIIYCKKNGLRLMINRLLWSDRNFW